MIFVLAGGGELTQTEKVFRPASEGEEEDDDDEEEEGGVG